MTKNDDKRIPALRFKGFNDDWAQHKLRNILIVNSGKDYKELNKGNVPVYGTGGYMMISVDHALSHKDAVGIGRKGSINKPQYLKAPFWTVDTLFFMTTKENNNLEFIYSLSQTINWKKYDESTGLPSLSKNTINNISIKTPSYFEQKKIGKIISQIDTLLSLQQRKLKQYQLIKKWLCSVVFNDTVHDDANILFSNRVKANQLFESISKKGFKDLPVLSASQEKGMVFRDDISKNITYTNSNLNNYKLVSPGNFVVHLRSFQGGFSYSNKIGIASPAYTIFEFKDNIKYDSIFWKEKFKSYNFIQLLKKVTYGVRDGRSISFSDFLSLYLTFPDIEIQKKIGKCFKALDNQISDQQCIIQQLKQLKQFLLQNMFI